MAQASDRSLFLEMAKTKPMTIQEVIDQFDVARNTARNWVKHGSMALVEGTWPPAYRNTNGPELPVVPSGKAKPKDGYVFHIPPIEEEKLKALFEKVMSDEAPEFNVTEVFRRVDSLAALAAMENRLKSWLVLSEYFRKLMEEEGIE